MRRGWRIGLSTLAVLAVLDTLAWYFGTAQLAAGTDRWIADARRQGWVVTEQEQKRSRGGWPFAATLAIAAPEIAGGDALLPGGLRWSSQRLVLAVSLFHPTLLALEAAGAQRLRVSGRTELAFTAGALTAGLRLWGGAPALARIRAEAVSGGIAGSGRPQDLRIVRLQLRLSDVSETGAGHLWPSGTLQVSASGIALPGSVQWPLGSLVSELSGTFRLESPPAGATVPAGIEGQAQAWRDAGGKLDAHDVRLRWGPLNLTATASLTLDGRMQPAGTGSADLAGSAATLAALSDAGMITPSLAATAAAMTAFMPRAPGDADAIRLPLRLRDGRVSVAQIPVFEIAEVRWK